MHLLRLERAAAVILALAAGAATARADGWEISVSAGKVFPFYDQTFTYDPGPLRPPIPGATPLPCCSRRL